MTVSKYIQALTKVNLPFDVAEVGTSYLPPSETDGYVDQTNPLWIHRLADLPAGSLLSRQVERLRGSEADEASLARKAHQAATAELQRWESRLPLEMRAINPNKGPLY